MLTSSRLDLTGQASEDERAPRPLRRRRPNPSHAQSGEQRGHGELPSRPTRRRNDASNADAELSDARGGGMLAWLRSPIDLWHSRTPLSLMLLPFMLFLYIVLQLPLDFNSTTIQKDVQGRARDVSKLSSELTEVERELDHAKGDQAEIKGMVGSLRRRLGRMRERRDARERMQQMKERERKERERHEKQAQQRGVAGDGPIATVSMAKPLEVATFAGKPSVDGTKKDD